MHAKHYPCRAAAGWPQPRWSQAHLQTAVPIHHQTGLSAPLELNRTLGTQVLYKATAQCVRVDRAGACPLLHWGPISLTLNNSLAAAIELGSLPWFRPGFEALRAGCAVGERAVFRNRSKIPMPREEHGRRLRHPALLRSLPRPTRKFIIASKVHARELRC